MVDETGTGTSASAAASRFPPTRESALRRLAGFVPRAGQTYAAGRNTDEGPDRAGAVSRLSPYVRHRLVTEREIVERVLATHGVAAAGKFVQEVLWRSYWKGWLEMRPIVWSRFLEERDRQREALADARGVTDAERGATGIEGFDDWARELVATGYLHNHARMWFASIWIFTLRLPWALGADFFLRHLLDADAASNTLSWRWVAGLQTVGKTYLATAENIARHCHGRFAPVGLATEAIALTEAPPGAAATLPELPPHDPREPAVLLVTTEDLNPESLFPREADFPAAIVAADGSLMWGDAARRFVFAAASDTVARAAAHLGRPVGLAGRLDLEVLVDAARAAGVRRIVTPYAPVGPVADALKRHAPGLDDEGITMVRVRRDWDTRCWPHAQKGFFAFRERMPSVLGEQGLA